MDVGRPRGVLLKTKTGMLRAIGLVAAWFAALIHEDPKQQECFCNCTCSIDHRFGESQPTWHWEIIKGLFFTIFGALCAASWKFILWSLCKIGQWLGTFVSSQFNHRGEVGNALKAVTEAGETSDRSASVEVLAREQLATVRHRQALRQSHGPR